jgi:hypothetical protein
MGIGSNLKSWVEEGLNRTKLSQQTAVEIRELNYMLLRTYRIVFSFKGNLTCGPTSIISFTLTRTNLMNSTIRRYMICTDCCIQKERIPVKVGAARANEDNLNSSKTVNELAEALMNSVNTENQHIPSCYCEHLRSSGCCECTQAQ